MVFGLSKLSVKFLEGTQPVLHSLENGVVEYGEKAEEYLRGSLTIRRLLYNPCEFEIWNNLRTRCLRILPFGSEKPIEKYEQYIFWEIAIRMWSLFRCLK
jgi:hypothetical protein